MAEQLIAVVAVMAVSAALLGAMAALVIVVWRWPKRNSAETLDLAWGMATAYERGLRMRQSPEAVGGEMSDLRPVPFTEPKPDIPDFPSQEVSLGEQQV